MANRGDETFFDVLIDRLIVDVKKDFERNFGHEPDSAEAPPTTSTNSASSMDDLVGRMIDFRTRMAMSTTSRAMSSYDSSVRPSASRRFKSEDVEMATSGIARTKANPKFSSSDSELAYQLVLKSGAQFYLEDLLEGSISREALKRERRRVLLSLHPDRHPEADRARAHEAFLQAADSFSILAEARLTAGASSRAA